MKTWSKKHRHFPQYSKSLIPYARRLRRQMTDAEAKLWRYLRNNNMEVKFRRQVPMGRYILDFYCVRKRLNIEVDGSQHFTEDGMRKDARRDQWLRKQGIEVMRFNDGDVLLNTTGVVQAIYERITEIQTPS